MQASISLKSYIADSAPIYYFIHTQALEEAFIARRQEQNIKCGVVHLIKYLILSDGTSVIYVIPSWDQV